VCDKWPEQLAKTKRLDGRGRMDTESPAGTGTDGDAVSGNNDGRTDGRLDGWCHVATCHSDIKPPQVSQSVSQTGAGKLGRNTERSKNCCPIV